MHLKRSWHERFFAALAVSICMVPSVYRPAFSEESAGKGANSTIAQADGLRTATFEVHSGTIDVKFPDDIAAGDTISGITIATPKANSPEELGDLAHELDTYVVELANVRPVSGRAHRSNATTAAAINISATSAHAHNFSCVVPGSGDNIQVVLKGKDRKVLATQEIPLGPKRSEAARKSRSLDLPSEGEAGRPISIGGNFDGRYSSSHLSIGGKSCLVQTVSPRQLVCLTPRNVVGKTTIDCRSGGVAAKGKFNNKESSADKNGDVLDLRGGWSGLAGPITIIQSGPFVSWDTGSTKYWGTVTKHSLDFEFHNYRHESRGKGHLVPKKVKGYTDYLDGFYMKTSINKKTVSNPKHVCHLFRQ